MTTFAEFHSSACNASRTTSFQESVGGHERINNFHLSQRTYQCLGEFFPQTKLPFCLRYAEGKRFSATKRPHWVDCTLSLVDQATSLKPTRVHVFETCGHKRTRLADQRTGVGGPSLFFFAPAGAKWAATGPSSWRQGSYLVILNERTWSLDLFLRNFHSTILQAKGTGCQKIPRCLAVRVFPQQLRRC